MRTLLFAAAATAAIGLTAFSAPASAQAYLGVGPFGVEVGPHWRHGDWDGPRWHHGWRGAYAYGGDCRVIRERDELPNGRIILRTRRICD